MGKDIIAHRYAERGSIYAGRPEMDTSEDAGVLDLIQRLCKVEEVPRDSRHGIRIHVEGSLLAKNLRENAGGRAAYAGVRGWIFREGGGGDQRRPGGVSSGGVIVIRVAELDSRNRAPGAVS